MNDLPSHHEQTVSCCCCWCVLLYCYCCRVCSSWFSALTCLRPSNSAVRPSVCRSVCVIVCLRVFQLSRRVSLSRQMNCPKPSAGLTCRIVQCRTRRCRCNSSRYITHCPRLRASRRCVLAAVIGKSFSLDSTTVRGWNPELRQLKHGCLKMTTRPRRDTRRRSEQTFSQCLNLILRTVLQIFTLSKIFSPLFYFRISILRVKTHNSLLSEIFFSNTKFTAMYTMQLNALYKFYSVI